MPNRGALHLLRRAIHLRGTRRAPRGSKTWDIGVYLVIVAFVAIAVFVCTLLARRFLAGSSSLSTYLGAKPGLRLEIIEQSNLDGRHKLLLIRRDDVEHLVMIGGPEDVVIESGISTKPSGDTEAVDAQQTFSGKQRSFLGHAFGNR